MRARQVTNLSLLSLLILPLLTSCAGRELEGTVQGTQTRLQDAIANGSKTIGCAPKETALAEVNIKAAEEALKMGEYYRGKEHVILAGKYTEIAELKTDPVRCHDPGDVPDAAAPTATDRDGDGYDDDVDGCPDEAEDFDAFEDEDGCPDPDNDQDGILDTEDTCPNEAEDFDQFEDEDGCPEADNDNDGILDPDDSCPLQPEDMDGDKDEDGCPDLTVDVDPCEIKLKDKVYFKFNKWDIEAKSFELLDDVVTVLNQNPDITLEIGGHTDSKGGNKYNKKLSQRRVDSVREYIISKGIDAGRMVAKGYGEEVPIDTNRTPEGRANNRRVEFKRTDNPDCN